VSAVFVDTSAFLALLDSDDEHHVKAKKVWAGCSRPMSLLITSNYALVETFALLRNRLGMEAVRVFQDDIVTLFDIRWVDAATHAVATGALLSAGRRKLSLVDCSSFEVMRLGGIRRALTLDRHFREQGFDSLP
jgi:uncharacterized protein